METELKRIRMRYDTSQQQLAEIAGVSIRSISRYENGAQMPTIDVAIRIARYYDVPVEEVFRLEEYQ